MENRKEFIRNRLGKIGASEIAGLVKEYANALLEKKVIDEDFYANLVEMPNFLDTRYSLAHKLEFDEQQLTEFSQFIENDAMRRGRACEELVMQQFLNENKGFEIVSSQNQITKTLKGVDIKLGATLDYIIKKDDKKYIHECKTTDISRFFMVGDVAPFNYIIQLQEQLYFNDLKQGFITIAGIQSISKGRGKGKDYQCLEHKTFFVEFDQMFIDAITQSVFWFDYELKNNKDEIFAKEDKQKTKADFEIDAFIEDFTATKEEIADGEFSKKINRLEELKPLVKEFKNLESEIKTEVENRMGLSRKIKLIGNGFSLLAKYTKPSFYDEDSILAEIKKKEEALDKAKHIELNSPKSKPYIKYNIEL